jgi:hypothetical protein
MGQSQANNQPMALKEIFSKSGNTFITLLLRSPFHGMLSKNFMLVTLEGRKTGRKINLPVNYCRSGDLLYTISLKNRKWWRNLRGGGKVTLRLAGRDRAGWGEVIEENGKVALALSKCLDVDPLLGKYLLVERNGRGNWDFEALAEAAKSRVVVQIRLTKAQRGENDGFSTS